MESVFEIIAEPNRRAILSLLVSSQQSVGEIERQLGMPQPAVSKHLGVLRKVGLVAVVKEGQQRVYSLEAEKLKTVHDWVRAFEDLWSQQLDRIKERAERRAREQTESPTSSNPRKDKA